MKPLVCLLLLSVSAFAETLHIYTWADYVSPEVVGKFEKKHGCKVVVDTFDSNESMYAKLKAGATGYDLVPIALLGSATSGTLAPPAQHQLRQWMTRVLRHGRGLPPRVVQAAGWVAMADFLAHAPVPATSADVLLLARRRSRQPSWVGRDS